VPNLPIETEDITVREIPSLLRHEYADVGRGMSRCVESMWVSVSVGVKEEWTSYQRPEMSDTRKTFRNAYYLCQPFLHSFRANLYCINRARADGL
jgi:hypothetical protein